MKNIWICFETGSGGTTLEYIIRKFTDLDTLPITYGNRKSPKVVDESHLSHNYERQWHNISTNKHPKGIAKVNIFTPVYYTDLSAMKKYIESKYKNDKNLIYILSASNAESALFSLACRRDRWNKMSNKLINKDIENYIKQRTQLYKIIKQGSNFEFIDIIDMFTDVYNVAVNIINDANGNIINKSEMISFCQNWQDKNKKYLDQYYTLFGQNNVELTGTFLYLSDYINSKKT